MRTNGAHAVVQPPGPQPPLRDLKAAALPQQHIAGRHAHILRAARTSPAVSAKRKCMLLAGMCTICAPHFTPTVCVRACLSCRHPAHAGELAVSQTVLMPNV